MNKTIKIYIAAMLGVVVFLVVVDAVRVQPLNWEPTYSLDTKNPFDLYVFDREMKSFFPHQKVEKVTTSPFMYVSEHHEAVNYLVIKPTFFNLSDTALINEVKNGSNLFLSSENMTSNFSDSLGVYYRYVESKPNYDVTDSAELLLTTKSWKNKNFFLKRFSNTYMYIDMDPGKSVILGKTKMKDEVLYPNFIKIKVGKGSIFLHNQPQVFTNFSLLDRPGSAEYVSMILSQISNSMPVVWLVNDQTTNTGEPINDSLLSVIFRHPALRAVWLLVFYGLILFILFNVKRRQRIIPVIKPLKNTTVEFVQTIGNLYFQEGNTANIVEKKIVYFLDKIRNKYYIDTQLTDITFADKLHKKTGKDKKLINKILEFINNFREQKQASRDDLVYLNKLLEEFWEIRK